MFAFIKGQSIAHTAASLLYVRHMLSAVYTSHTLFHTQLKLFRAEYPMVIWGKERAWISKQHKAMRNFKGNGTITANKILEANECVCLCLWQWLRGVNRRISSHLQSLNTSHSHYWIKTVRLLHELDILWKAQSAFGSKDKIHGPPLFFFFFIKHLAKTIMWFVKNSWFCSARC